MSPQALQLVHLLAIVVTTIASQYAGYKALVRKLDAKADKQETDKRLKALEEAHGGLLR